jgi:hypothetical protein
MLPRYSKAVLGVSAAVVPGMDSTIVEMARSVSPNDMMTITAVSALSVLFAYTTNYSTQMFALYSIVDLKEVSSSRRTP